MRQGWAGFHSRAFRRTFGGLSAAAVIGCLAVLAIDGRAAASEGDTQAPPKLRGPTLEEALRNGEIGFVVTHISYSLGPDAKGSGTCPNGMTGGVRGLIDALSKTPAGQRKPGESDRAYEMRMTMAVNTAPNGQNICLHPEASSPDPGWRMVSGRNIKVDGIDLDGQDSAPGKRTSAGSCAHEDFQGTQGERGIDNQFYRVVGCTTGFQSTGQANSFRIEMYTGSWGILVKLKGVDNLRNDPEVEVGIYANADPIQLSASRDALPFATYATDQDPRYRATTRGRIVDGVLTIDPVDLRFHNYVNSMHDDRELRDARLRLKLTEDGGEGIMAGYWPVENAYDLGYGSRTSRNAKGELAPERLRMGTSVGRAGALGHSCNGAYYALYQAADGHRDPATGRCTSISTQYRIGMTPAFVVDAPTQSVNASLVKQ